MWAALPGPWGLLDGRAVTNMILLREQYPEVGKIADVVSRDRTPGAEIASQSWDSRNDRILF
jgi:hypothetical protein